MEKATFIYLWYVEENVNVESNGVDNGDNKKKTVCEYV